MKLSPLWLLVPLTLILAGCARRQAAPGSDASALQWPGRQPDGSMLLPNQWSLRPVGRQIGLGDFPVNVAVHPGGTYAAVLHCGQSEHLVLVVDLREARVVSRTPIKEAFYGLVFSADGKILYCSGAAEETVHGFDFAGGQLTNARALRVRPAKDLGVPAGLAADSRGGRLFVANLRAERVTEIGLAAGGRVEDIVIGTNAPQLQPELKPSPDEDRAAIEKRAQVALLTNSPSETFPYACVLDEKRDRLYVSLWGQAAVAVIDLRARKVSDFWRTQEHPCEMVLTRSGKYLFVANANRNTVTVLDTQQGKAVETIWAALYPNSPPGSTPNSLALSPDETLLFVANACNNAVAVFDVSRPGKSRSLGFIPTGWYPTSVRVTPDGKKLLIANGKGLEPKANPEGPQPGERGSGNRTVQYIARLFQGSLSVIDLPAKKDLDRQLAQWSAMAYECSPLKPDAGVVSAPVAGNPIPSRLGQRSPIKYCLYIIKENRTYDQVFGDLPQGRGDPSLCLFPERVTPNHHQLVKEWVLLDNFYVESEVSADGHEWSMGAYASDFVEKFWPLGYGHNSSGKFPYASEGSFAIAAPAGGYIWDRAREAGVTYRSYGEFIANATATRPARAKVKALEGHFDPEYRSFDMSYPDVKRAERFISELRRFEQEGEMPRLQILRLPNDHTSGTSAGAHTPTAAVGDNDLALGRVVEAVTRSKFWPQTAIFVVEDDAQNGPDHVDAHRTVAMVISPYARRGAVDSSLYSTSSMLRTMELILGLRPMTQFDAAARPMYNCFQAEPDDRPYTCLPANVDLNERNTRQAWGSEIKLNLASEDAVDDLLLNEMVWRSVRGPDWPMPSPVRAGFVITRGDADEDDD